MKLPPKKMIEENKSEKAWRTRPSEMTIVSFAVGGVYVIPFITHPGKCLIHHHCFQEKATQVQSV